MMMALAILLGTAAGTLCGLIDGLLIAYGKPPPFITTLGMMRAGRDATLLYGEGRPISGFADEFRMLATGEMLFVPAPVWMALVVYATAHLVLACTKLGRYVYAMGGNEEAARLSAVDVPFFNLFSEAAFLLQFFQYRQNFFHVRPLFVILVHLAKTNDASFVDDDNRRMRNNVFVVNLISFHDDQTLIGSKWKSDSQILMPFSGFFRRVAMNADEHSVILFKLRKILLQLAELLLAPGSPRAAAEKL
jgi:hypothetical protein